MKKKVSVILQNDACTFSGCMLAGIIIIELAVIGFLVGSIVDSVYLSGIAELMECEPILSELIISILANVVGLGIGATIGIYSYKFNLRYPLFGMLVVICLAVLIFTL